MKWRKNTGVKPTELDSQDMVFVRLRNGAEHGPWRVRTNAQSALRWSLNDCEFDVVEWRRG